MPQTVALNPTITIQVPIASTTPVPTLSDEELQARVSLLLNSNKGCSIDVACFWGVVAGQTTLDELKTMFGEPYQFSHYAEYSFSSREGVEVSAIFSINSGIVENGHIEMYFDNVGRIPPSKWQAFSLPSLIQKYGYPTELEIGIDLGIERPDESFVKYDLYAYFPVSNLLVIYINGTASVGNEIQFCPMEIGERSFVSLDMFFGENFEYMHVRPIGEDTVPPIQEFYATLLETPDKACLSIDKTPFVHID